MSTQTQTQVVTSQGNTSAVDALEISQGGHRIFVTALSARQLIDCATIDHYNSNLAPGDPNQGYQRPPERSRITRIGNYLIKRAGDGFNSNFIKGTWSATVPERGCFGCRAKSPSAELAKDCQQMADR